MKTVEPRLHPISWTQLSKRVFDIDMQHYLSCCCGGLKTITAVLARLVIEKVFRHLGELPERGRPKRATAAKT